MPWLESASVSGLRRQIGNRKVRRDDISIGPATSADVMSHSSHSCHVPFSTDRRGSVSDITRVPTTERQSAVLPTNDTGALYFPIFFARHQQSAWLEDGGGATRRGPCIASA